MHAEVTLRNVVAAAPHLVDLSPLARCHSNTSANRVTAVGCEGLYEKSVTLLPIVLQKRGRLVHIDDDDLQAPVVIEIANGSASRGVPGIDARTCLVGGVVKVPVSSIPIEQSPLVERL